MTTEELVSQRGDDYGHPKQNFQLIADYWSVYKGIKFTPEDIPIMMILTKIAREQHTHKSDNYEDIKGYAHTGEMLYEDTQDT